MNKKDKTKMILNRERKGELEFIESLVYMIVCAPKEYDVDEIIAASTTRPCGTSSGWLYMDEGHLAENGLSQGIQCPEHEDRVHYFFVC